VSPPLIMKKFFLLSLIFLSLSCFKLREAEEPVGEEVFLYPDEPHKVLQNIRNAYIYKLIDNLKSSIDSANYTFHPDPSLLEGPNGPLYENWDYVKEINFTSNLFLSLSPDVPYPITFSSFDIEDSDTLSDEVKFLVFYEFSVEFNDGSNVNARGTSLFDIVLKPEGLWILREWWDFKDTSTTYLSWAEVKALKNTR